METSCFPVTGLDDSLGLNEILWTGVTTMLFSSACPREKLMLTRKQWAYLLKKIYRWDKSLKNYPWSLNLWKIHLSKLNKLQMIWLELIFIVSNRGLGKLNSFVCWNTKQPLKCSYRWATNRKEKMFMILLV